MAGFAKYLRPLAHDLHALATLDRAGGLGEMLKLMQRLKGVDLTFGFLDSTVVRTHQHAAGAAKEKAIRPSAAPGAD